MKNFFPIFENQTESTLFYKHATWSACYVTLSGFIISFGFCAILDSFWKFILASLLSIICAGHYFTYMLNKIESDPKQSRLFKLSPAYKPLRYLHFFLTSYAFAIIAYTCLKSMMDADGWNLPLLSIRVFLVNNILYHYGEFLFVCFCHPGDLQWSSFLINHSTGYTIALLAAFIEYSLGFLSPQFGWFILHDSPSCIIIGLIFSLFGHTMRMGAFWTARSNFNHLVQSKKQQGHVLVKNGVYSFSRHPSYLGFFLYSIGGQIILGNIFCFFAYIGVLFKFFLFRIVQEEYFLVNFFGKEYEEYRQKVPIRIPFLQFAINQNFSDDYD